MDFLACFRKLTPHLLKPITESSDLRNRFEIELESLSIFFILRKEPVLTLGLHYRWKQYL